MLLLPTLFCYYSASLAVAAAVLSTNAARFKQGLPPLAPAPSRPSKVHSELPLLIKAPNGIRVLVGALQPRTSPSPYFTINCPQTATWARCCNSHAGDTCSAALYMGHDNTYGWWVASILKRDPFAHCYCFSLLDPSTGFLVLACCSGPVDPENGCTLDLPK